MPIYVYAITADPGPDLPAVPGVGDMPLYRVAAPGLAAVVSDIATATIRAERRHLAAAYTVTRGLQALGDALPAAFGTIAPSAGFLEELLVRHAPLLLDRLDRLKGACEMGLRLRLDGLEPMAFLVARSAALRRARDRVFGRGRTPRYDERIDLGRQCEAEFGRFRERVAALVAAQLEPACRELAQLPVGAEAEIAHLAALVSRDRVADFEAAVEAAAAGQEQELVFQLLGPLPPHHFARLELPA